jgi:amino acid adenylation domain-containing protein
MQEAATTAGFQLSPEQSRLWREQGEGPAFQSQITVLLEGKLDELRLRHALDTVVSRHEALRTTFGRQPGLTLPFQVVNSAISLPWNVTDLTSFTNTDQEVRLEELLREQAQRPLNFASGPLAHVELVRLSADRYVLALTTSSLVADPVSLQRIVGEAAYFYGGSQQDNPADEPLQYADFAQWQNELAAEPQDESSAGSVFWKQSGITDPPPLALPFQRRAEPSAEFSPATLSFRLDGDLVARAERLGKPLRSFFLSCWQALLFRLSAQSEVLVGCVSDGRTEEELKGSIGLFCRTLPIRSSLEDSTFTQALDETDKTLVKAEDLQYLLRWDESMPRLPWRFRYDELLPSLTAGELRFQQRSQRSMSSRFCLELACVRQGSGCTAEFRFDSQAFERETVERFAEYFRDLVASAIASPDRKISELEILSDAERRQILLDFNRTSVALGDAQCIHSTFEKQAERAPTRPALRFGERQLTYQELNESSNQLARYLRAQGVKPDTIVGLCVDRSAEMIIGLLAILKAGGAYVPLVPDNPKARLAYQLAETAAPILLTETKFLPQLPEFSGQILCFDRDASRWQGESKSNLQHDTTPDNLVYVIYTSGSTGVPKGVAVRHANLANYTQAIIKQLALEKEKDGLAFATVSTLAADLGNTSIFPALLSGGCLHVIGYDVALDGNQFSAYAAAHPIDVLKITPSHLNALLSSAEPGKVLPRRYLLLGGEAFTWELLRKVEQAGTCAVINHYGPTEATVGCCTFHVKDHDVSRWAPATVPIGRPLENAQVYILDRNLQPAPLGVPGELCIGGKGLAAGYINQAKQTAERFVPNPHVPGSLIYRTGDLARFLPDGNVEFLGRIDHQIKIRGFRVEPAEIEAVLKRHPAVQQAVLIPLEEKSGDKRLVAYVVPFAGSTISPEELRALAHQSLPEYMVPSAFVPLHSLPLNANGKLDRRALPSPDQARESSHEEQAMPQSPIEQSIAAIWCEVLSLPRVGVQENFFELGGHSLLATQVMSRVCNQFQVRLPLRTLFEAPTVGGLAAAVAQVQPQNADEVASLLKDLEGVSEEEAERLLAAELKNAGDSSQAQ